MKLETTRFGELDIPEDMIIEMKKPVLGFEELRQYVIVETEDFEPFRWFQSIDNPDTAFVLVNPLLFFPDYQVEVNPREIEELAVDNPEEVIAYVIVTIPRDYTKMTANLQGPILINTRTRLAKQIVLVNSQYRIRHRLIQTDAARQHSQDKVPVGI